MKRNRQIELLKKQSLTDKGGNHMRFATIKVNGTEKAGIVLKNGVLPIEALNAAKGTAWAEDMMSLIQNNTVKCILFILE